MKDTITNFDEIKNQLGGFLKEQGTDSKIGAEIAVNKLTDKNLSDQLSILDEQDKKIALKLMCIEEVLLTPPSIMTRQEKILFKTLAKKCNKVRSEFMTICKSTGGMTQNNIKDIFTNGITLNDNSIKHDNVLRLKK